jgi:hypothetical protein
MLHFTPHKRARIAFREEILGGGGKSTSYSSNEICVAHIASCSLSSAIFGQYSGLRLHLGNRLDFSHLHNMLISDIRI